MTDTSVSAPEAAAQRVRTGYLSEQQRGLLADLLDAINDFLHDDLDEGDLAEAFTETVDQLLAGPTAPPAASLVSTAPVTS